MDADEVRELSGARLIHIAGYLHDRSMWDDGFPALLRDAHARGQMVSLDPQFPLFPVEGRWLTGVERLLPYVDVLLTDQDEARGITGLDDLDAAGQFLQPLLRKSGLSIVVIKRGADGALIFNGRQRVEQTALPVPDAEIVDTIGAGDAFAAGFLAALLRNHTPLAAVKIGTAVAGRRLRGHSVCRRVES